MGRRTRSIDTSRVPGRFCALPHDVLCCEGYLRLGYASRALLIEAALQYTGHNNGRITLTMSSLRSRGWTSNDVIFRARQELVELDFLYVTAQGRRPHRATWYALTWHDLSTPDDPRYDPGARRGFRRGAYRQKSAVLTPPPGTGLQVTAPSPGEQTARAIPPPGAVPMLLCRPSAPGGGDHLERPSAAAVLEAL